MLLQKLFSHLKIRGHFHGSEHISNVDVLMPRPLKISLEDEGNPTPTLVLRLYMTRAALEDVLSIDNAQSIEITPGVLIG